METRFRDQKDGALRSTELFRMAFSKKSSLFSLGKFDKSLFARSSEADDLQFHLS